MDEPVSAADANRRFSLLLRGVREEGHSYVVTSHGKPVARLVPVGKHGVAAGARAALLTRLENQPVLNVPRWTRDDLYEDER